MGLVYSTGRRTAEIAASFRDTCAFLGEAFGAMAGVALRPRSFRFRDFALAFQRAAYEGLAITSGIGLLLGIILAFESAAALRTFGAEVYVSDLLTISLFRELGPLVTAIVLAGRSGSAFAAEIGVMKVDEELDALTTMGLPPVRFLVPPRVFAAVLAMPILTVCAELAGLAGGAGVLQIMGVPVPVFWAHVKGTSDLFMVGFGLFKSCIFGFLVGMTGCGAGLSTKQAADGVGVAATSAVVAGIVAIAVADGLLAVVCHVWGV